MQATNHHTMRWLERQLSQLEAWKRDLICEGADEQHRLEQLNLHRDWLERRLSELAALPHRSST